jgi:signal transduction histidine kinase
MDRATILNVDDFEPGRYARTKLLRSFGFEVREATTGAEALRLVLDERPALVILDVNLPDISGFEVCRRLKESPTTATLPVLQMSATYTGGLHQALGLEGGADGYLIEPVDPPVLLATLKALLRMKRAEETQRLTALQWQATFEAISEGVALLDADGLVVRCNQAFRGLLADAGPDPVGQPLGVVLPEPTAGADTLVARIRSSRRRETREWEIEGRWLRATLDPMEEGERFVGAVCTVSDVSERRLVEEQRQQSLAREHAARAAAEAANNSKDEFIAMLAHELRTPLAPIRMAMHTLRRAAERDPDVQRATEVVERQSRHLARLLDDLLDVARLAREKVVLDRRATALQTVVGEALESSRELLEARHHAVRVALPDAPVWLDVDPMRLTQVVGNLLNNAAKYTTPGGVIIVTGEVVEREAVLRIRDNGVGIAPETLGRIFDLFAQGDGTASCRERGLGVGLTLARMLVEFHGGTLTAASEGLGHGSEFVVRLPLGVPPAAESAPASNGRSAPASERRRTAAKHRVLVIEDDEDTREVVRLLLQSDGHHVETAASGAEGTELAIRTLPDVVLVDIGLPGLDGYAVGQRIRDALGDGVFMVAVTGYGRDEDRRRAVEAGFDLHLVKPVDYESVVRLLSERRLRRGHEAGSALHPDRGVVDSAAT